MGWGVWRLSQTGVPGAWMQGSTGEYEHPTRKFAELETAICQGRYPTEHFFAAIFTSINLPPRPVRKPHESPHCTCIGCQSFNS